MTRFSFLSKRTRHGMVVFCSLVLTAGSAAAVASASSSGPAAKPDVAALASASVVGMDVTPASGVTTPACAPDTTVSTRSGPVCGLARDGDNQWLGIPYAAPPVGSLRWRPPQPLAPWTVTLHATAFGSECSQSFNGSPPAGDENCLFINVVRPAGPAPSSPRPVLVHIHGGGFVGGSGNGDYSLLANAGNDVVVSMNYRVGIFGFLADRSLGAHSGDYGLQDQQAALRWVRDNIRSFGGDPTNVTIYGESAGGSSVCDQIASPTANGLFEKAVSVSGEYATLFGSPNQILNFQDCKSTPPTQEVADRAGERLVAAVSCAHAANVADCLRQVPAPTVLNAAGGGFTSAGTGTISPTLNANVLPLSLRQALARGKANRVRVIAGTARDENLAGQAETPAQYRTLVEQQFGSSAAAVLREYPLERFYSPFVAFRTVSADAYTVCPAIVTAQMLAKRMPTWEYQVDDGDAPLPSLPFLQPDAPNGAYHVAAWFVTPTPGLDPNQTVLQQQEVADLTTFAATGNPTGKFTPTWPEFNGTGEVMSWAPGGDSQLTTTAQMALDHNCAFWNNLSPKP
ncbi:MAG: para-nitrobenzyl esterase [Mycobacterium sp.]|jgi:para-nitrobenzyl esterase|nr:para-nitrobenzyl esterase [Mycobacterium sp.]